MAEQNRLVVQLQDGTITELVPTFGSWQPQRLPCGHWCEARFRIDTDGRIETEIRRPESIERYT